MIYLFINICTIDSPGAHFPLIIRLHVAKEREQVNRLTTLNYQLPIKLDIHHAKHNQLSTAGFLFSGNSHWKEKSKTQKEVSKIRDIMLQSKTQILSMACSNHFFPKMLNNCRCNVNLQKIPHLNAKDLSNQLSYHITKGRPFQSNYS